MAKGGAVGGSCGCLDLEGVGAVEEGERDDERFCKQEDSRAEHGCSRRWMMETTRAGEGHSQYDSGAGRASVDFMPSGGRPAVKVKRFDT